MKKLFLKNSHLLLTCLFVFFIFALESPRACLKNKNCTNQMLHFPFS